MLLTSSKAAFLLVAPLPLLLCTTAVLAGSHITVPIVNARGTVGRSGISSTKASIQNAKRSVTRLQRATKGSIGSGVLEDRASVPLSASDDDSGYLATLKLGTPPQDFTLLMDTGSADLWVVSEDCNRCGDHKALGPSTSSTYRSSYIPWLIQYGSGSTSGVLAEDVISVAGLTLNHTFGVANHVAAVYRTSPIDGICGLAKRRAANQFTPTLINSLYSSKLIPSPIVSYKLPRIQGPDDQGSGEITFGALNPAAYNPSTQVVVPNTDYTGFWAVRFDNILVGGQKVQVRGNHGVLDIGTVSHLLFIFEMWRYSEVSMAPKATTIVPEDDARAIHRLIPGSRLTDDYGWIVPCDTNATFSLNIGGREFTTLPSDIAIAGLDTNDGYCLSGFTPADFSERWVIGENFLRNVYFSTNEATDRITIAKLA